SKTALDVVRNGVSPREPRQVARFLLAEEYREMRAFSIGERGETTRRMAENGSGKPGPELSLTDQTTATQGSPLTDARFGMLARSATPSRFERSGDVPNLSSQLPTSERGRGKRPANSILRMPFLLPPPTTHRTAGDNGLPSRTGEVSFRPPRNSSGRRLKITQRRPSRCRGFPHPIPHHRSTSTGERRP
ncbi:MAG: hypothetical protein RIS35_3619, partial [Pseudomonadota bacterium]